MLESISGRTKLLGLIGSPVGHSGSPAMYNYGFEQLGYDAVYLAFDVKLEETAKAIDAFRTLKLAGGNVTMPCKSEALKHVDELSPAAEMVGAINTIVNHDGKLVGHITDGIGFVENLKNHGVAIADRQFVVIGTGGAATAIQVQLAIEGAKSISIFNIKDAFYKNGEATVKKVKKHYPDFAIEIHDLADNALLREKIAQADVLINGTTFGMGENSTNTPISDVTMFHKELVVADSIYNPPVTQLLKDAKENGCEVVGGKGMLLEQGKAAFKLFTGEELPVQPDKN